MKPTIIKDSHSPIEIVIDRTNGGKGRINAIRVYYNNELKSLTTLLLKGQEIETIKIDI